MARKEKAEKPVKAKKAEVRTIDADGVEEVKGGLGFEDGIILTTFIALLGAVVMLFMALSRYPR
ncbi:MAG: hypothetical protein U1F36_04510 [Planctomycetota bacterium]